MKGGGASVSEHTLPPAFREERLSVAKPTLLPAFRADSEPLFPRARASQYTRGTRTGLTSGFGMGPGVPPSLWPSAKRPIKFPYINLLAGHTKLLLHAIIKKVEGEVNHEIWTIPGCTHPLLILRSICGVVASKNFILPFCNPGVGRLQSPLGASFYSLVFRSHRLQPSLN